MSDVFAELQRLSDRSVCAEIGVYWNACEDAVDEIKRLRAEVGELKDERDDLRDLAERRRWGAQEMDRFRAENGRLRDDLRACVKELEQSIHIRRKVAQAYVFITGEYEDGVIVPREAIIEVLDRIKDWMPSAQDAVWAAFSHFRIHRCGECDQGYVRVCNPPSDWCSACDGYGYAIGGEQ